MNKKICTKLPTFISLVGPSGSGKSHLIFDWLKIDTFQPKFEKKKFFISLINLLMDKCKEKTLNFFLGDLKLIENLTNNGTKIPVNI